MVDKIRRNAIDEAAATTGCCPVNQNLSCSRDSVTICGKDANGTIQRVRTDSSGRLDITSTNLDIRDLNCSRDSIKICGTDGTNTTNIKTDSTGRLDVTATDFDIRNLKCADDSVTVCGSSGNPINTDSNGNITVNTTQSYEGHYDEEDIAPSSGFNFGPFDISKAKSYIFFVENTDTDNSDVTAFLEIFVDTNPVHKFAAQDIQVAAPSTTFLPILRPDKVSTGFPFPGQSAQLVVSNTGDTTVKVRVGFSAWK